VLGRFFQWDPVARISGVPYRVIKYQLEEGDPIDNLDPSGRIIPGCTARKPPRKPPSWRSIPPIEKKCKWCPGVPKIYGYAAMMGGRRGHWCCCACKKETMTISYARSGKDYSRIKGLKGTGKTYYVDFLAEIIRTLDAEVKKCHCVEKLTIFAEGTAFGITRLQSPSEGLVIPEVADFARKIKGVFCDTCIINLMACEVGAGTSYAGNFAAELAAATGCKVRATDAVLWVNPGPWWSLEWYGLGGGNIYEWDPKGHKKKFTPKSHGAVW